MLSERRATKLLGSQCHRGEIKRAFELGPATDHARVGLELNALELNAGKAAGTIHARCLDAGQAVGSGLDKEKGYVFRGAAAGLARGDHQEVGRGPVNDERFNAVKAPTVTVGSSSRLYSASLA